MCDEPNKGRVVLLWLSTLARVILGGSILVAGLLKVGHYQRGLLAVRAYNLPIGLGLEKAIAYTQPIVEIILGTMILVGIFTRVTASLGGFLMVVFMAMIISAWARGLAIDCGCFTPGGMLGPDQKTQYAWDLLRDVGFTICAVWLIIHPHSKLSLDSWVKRGRHG